MSGALMVNWYAIGSAVWPEKLGSWPQHVPVPPSNGSARLPPPPHPREYTEKLACIYCWDTLGLGEKNFGYHNLANTTKYTDYSILFFKSKKKQKFLWPVHDFVNLHQK